MIVLEIPTLSTFLVLCVALVSACLFLGSWLHLRGAIGVYVENKAVLEKIRQEQEGLEQKRRDLRREIALHARAEFGDYLSIHEELLIQDEAS